MKKSTFAIIVILISILAIGIRVPLINYVSGDMEDFVLVWMEQLKSHGGIKALGLEIGNYNIIYMTLLAILTYIPFNKMILVKILSIVFDFIIAWAGAVIIVDLIKKQEKKNIIFLISYGMLLFAPSLILNSSMWGQCDSIYVAFIILSIMFLIKKKYVKSLIMLGIAFAFKLQTIFIFPLYGLIYLGQKKFPFYYFFIIPIVNFISWLPAIINGRSIVSCVKIYLGQTETVNNLINRNIVNVYNFIFNANSTFVRDMSGRVGYIGIVLLLLIFIGISIMIMVKKIDIKDDKIFLIGIWGVLISVFLLPHMHERYLIIADILLVIYLLVYNKHVWVVVGINLISVYLYYIYLKGIHLLSIPPMLVAILFAIIVIYWTGYIVYKILETNKEREVKV